MAAKEPAEGLPYRLEDFYASDTSSSSSEEEECNYEKPLVSMQL